MLMTTVEMIVENCKGMLLAGEPSVVVAGLALDSRAVEPGSVFVAFSGENFDGHAFLLDALDAGARALIVTKGSEELAEELFERVVSLGAAVIQVDDALGAVQCLAAAHRRRLRAKVVGITGSTGKTTTKDLVAAVLSCAYSVVATQANRNNELGVPLTLLSADADTEVLVVEMGMRGPGQISELCAIAAPEYGLITNVGTSHVELLGSEDAIADAKAELVRSLPEHGRAFLNGDDARSGSIAAASPAPVVRYGLSSDNDVYAEDIELDAMSRASFTAVVGDERVRMTLAVPGRHNVYNALAAIAVGHHLGVALAHMADALSGAAMTGMRMEVLSTASGVTILNDTYNANPTSMRAAVETLSQLRGCNRRIAVLGDMGELGSFAELAHFRLGGHVRDCDLDVLVTVGPLARRIADGASAAGMDRAAVRACVTVEEAGAVLDDLVEAGDAVLVKASRMMGLEALVEGIVNPRV